MAFVIWHWVELVDRWRLPPSIFRQLRNAKSFYEKIILLCSMIQGTAAVGSGGSVIPIWSYPRVCIINAEGETYESWLSTWVEILKQGIKIMQAQWLSHDLQRQV